MQDGDHVRIQDGGQTMCDSDDCVLAELLTDQTLHQLIGRGVHVTGGFVEDEDFALAEHRSAQAKQLLLAPRKRLRLDLGVQATSRLDGVPQLDLGKRGDDGVVGDFAGRICVYTH